jgi:hypothetical protein
MSKDFLLYLTSISLICLYDNNIVEPWTYGLLKSQVERGLFFKLSYRPKEFLVEWKWKWTRTSDCICKYVVLNTK